MYKRQEDELFKMILVIIEMLGSVCYSSIIEGKPDTVDNMKPVPVSYTHLQGGGRRFRRVFEKDDGGGWCGRARSAYDAGISHDAGLCAADAGGRPKLHVLPQAGLSLIHI